MPVEKDLFYETLLARYLDAGETVARDWLATEIGERLARPGCRFLLLTGEPGAGKTGAMAALARSHPQWLRYFIRSDSTTPLSGVEATSLLLRLGHQLAERRPKLFDPELLAIEVRQRVEHAEPGAAVVGVRIEDLAVSPFYRTAIRVQQQVSTLSGGLVGVEIARATVEPRLLEPATLGQLALLDPARVLARRHPGETIVVLIDALDEVLATTGTTTVLDWLEALPDPDPNVRFVLTSRPDRRIDAFAAARGAPVERIALEPGSTAVTNDVRRFATRLFDETQALQRGRQPVLAEAAVAALARAALGNFAYLTAYARSLRAALAAGAANSVDELLAFDTLPSGLGPLYVGFARRMRRQIERLGQLEVENPRNADDELVPAWEGVGQRLLGVLVVALDPLDLDQLRALGGVRVWRRQAASVLEVLVPFLDQSADGWRLFHPSVGEALAQAVQAPDVEVDAREWHARIVRHYRGSAAWAAVDWEAMDTYGLRNVARHLAAIAPDPAAVSEVITRGLRTASRKRFFTDLPFLRVLETARAGIARSEDLGNVFAEDLFLRVVLSGVGAGARRLAPAVYGLMARLGRLDEALARTQVLVPGQFRYRAVEAIWRCTPAPLRERLGPLDGVELLVGEALEVSRTASPMVGFLGMDFSTCVCDAALALMPVDPDRALRLIALTEPYDPRHITRDRFFAQAIPLVPPGRALGLLQHAGDRRAKAALGAAERAAAGPERDRLVADAREHLDQEEASDQGPLLARLVALGAAVQPPDAAALEAWAAQQGRTGGAWGVVETAERLRARDPALAAKVLRSCDQPDVDSLRSSTFVAAAGLWASWGDIDESRRLLERALAEFRARGWYGPADDMVEAAQVAGRFDAAWSAALLQEAVGMVDAARPKAGEMERNKLDGTVARMVCRLREWNRPLAIELARTLTGGWIHGASWDSTHGRTSALAVLGLDAAGDDPAAAARLLDECTAADRAELHLGRVRAASPDQGLFAIATAGADGPARSSDHVAFFASYLVNSVNYWRSGRRWRAFDTPADVVQSMDACFPEGASWARVIAAAAPAMAEISIDRALALSSWLADASERLIALAPFVARLEDDDPRRPVVESAFVAAQVSLPRYRAQVDLREVPEAQVLAYLNPTTRASFEAQRLLNGREGPFRLLAHIPEHEYLNLVLQAERLCDELLQGAYSQMPPGELEQQLDQAVAHYGRADPLLRDLINAAAVRVFAHEAEADVAERVARIENPFIRAAADLACLPRGGVPASRLALAALDRLQALGDDVLPNWRAQLAAMAIESCRQADADADTAALLAWGLGEADRGDPLLLTRGLLALVPQAPAGQRGALLERALRAADDIGNQYLRTDALADLLAPALLEGEAALVSRTLGRLYDHGWNYLMEGLRRAAPSIVEVVGADAIDRIDAALHRAQAVLGDATDAQGHLDGVLAPAARVKSLREGLAQAALFDVPPYLALFLDAHEVPPALRRVQDTRLQRPDDDDAFAELGGLASGFAAWQGDQDQTVARIVDIRILFPRADDAARYHERRLTHNSEGRPEIAGVPGVGDECRVFGGTDRLQALPGVTVEMTAFFYIFRVGRVVVKLFVMQGVQAAQPLALERVRALAERCAERARASPYAV